MFLKLLQHKAYVSSSYFFYKLKLCDLCDVIDRVLLQGVALALEPEVDCSDSSKVAEAANKRSINAANYSFFFNYVTNLPENHDLLTSAMMAARHCHR